ncbi:hypothetical protein A2U01_0103261, partial [Trifolium medium]|nr:hypothetical protein [Trifolium medium]
MAGVTVWLQSQLKNLNQADHQLLSQVLELGQWRRYLKMPNLQAVVKSQKGQTRY